MGCCCCCCCCLLRPLLLEEDDDWWWWSRFLRQTPPPLLLLLLVSPSGLLPPPDAPSVIGTFVAKKKIEITTFVTKLAQRWNAVMMFYLIGIKSDAELPSIRPTVFTPPAHQIWFPRRASVTDWWTGIGRNFFFFFFVVVVAYRSRSIVDRFRLICQIRKRRMRLRIAQRLLLLLLLLDQVCSGGCGCGFQQFVQHLLSQQRGHSAGGDLAQKLLQIQESGVGGCRRVGRRLRRYGQIFRLHLLQSEKWLAKTSCIT